MTSPRVLDLTRLMLLLLGLCVQGDAQGTGGMSVPEVNCTATIQKGDQSLCLWLVTELRTWEEADADCERYGGYLVAVTSQEVNEVVVDIMRNYSRNNVWLGMEEKVTTWRWLSDQREVFHQGCFKEELDDQDMDVKFTLNNSYSACNAKCNATGKKYSRLQTPTLCLCGDEFGRHGTGDCNLLCEDRIEYCGGNRDGVISTWVNVPGGAYSDWELGQPNNHQLYQTCAVMDDFNKYQWNDIKCTELSGVICELRLSEAACGDGGFQYNTTWGCYLVSNSSMSFYDGLSYCDTRGGRLLELDGPNKRNFYVNEVLSQNSYTPRAFFIGLARAQWVWKTGDLFVYSSWGSGWPNGKDQNCAIVGEKGRWNDVTCSAPYSYICQRGSSPRTTPPPTTTPTTTQTTTTTPRPTHKPCDAKCHNDFRIYNLKKEDERKLMYYILMGGGALLVIILITCCICTIYCLKRHYKKKREKKFDYFFGVDVSRPEDDKEFKSAKGEGDSENGTQKRIMAASQTPDLVPVSDGAAVISEVAPPSEKSALDDSPHETLTKNEGIDNSGYDSTDRSSSVALVAGSSTNISVAPETESHKPDVETPSVSEVSPGTSEVQSNLDDASDASTAHVGDTDNKVLLPHGQVDMTNYDYDKPDVSQMMY